MLASSDLPSQFWNRVVLAPSGQCWDWTGVLDRAGYARYNNTAAHRRAFEALVGPIPDGNEVHHKCENKRCVNPEHLEALTRAEHARHHPNVCASECLKGHPFDGANTYISPAGKRYCRECRAEWYRTRARRNGASE